MTAPTPPRPRTALTRRRVLFGAAALGVLAGCGSPRDPIATGAPSTPTQTFEVSHTDQQWRQLLTPQQYTVLRQAGTERPFSSPLNDEHRPGIFGCAGCALDLFSSTTKFDSGTGWPSFWKALDNAVLERADSTLGMTRTEVFCSRCGGHLGHVFDDGPEPTGLRYCMNGVALRFRPT
jgi:peptide-methionine (R)-S-oxide reductase